MALAVPRSHSPYAPAPSGPAPNIGTDLGPVPVRLQPLLASLSPNAVRHRKTAPAAFAHVVDTAVVALVVRWPSAPGQFVTPSCSWIAIVQLPVDSVNALFA